MFACEDWKTVETILPSTADASLISDDVLPNKQWDWTGLNQARGNWNQRTY